MDQKILILGAKGMLGSALAKVFSDKNPILLDYLELDIADQKNLEEKLNELKPTLSINAAAYTDVDGAESNKELAMKVNGEPVGYLAEVAKKLGAILIHYSTDYVFDGEKKEGYTEKDKANPLNVYGQSKLQGEELLQQKGEMFYLIRSSWLYGENGKNFIDTILTKAGQEPKLKVVNDQFGKPTYTKDLARKTREIIDQMKPCGIYNVTNKTKEGGISWYELAKRAVELKNLKCEVVPCSTFEFPRPAKRPKYSALVNTKLGPVRHWREALKEYLNHEL